MNKVATQEDLANLLSKVTEMYTDLKKDIANIRNVEVIIPMDKLNLMVERSSRRNRGGDDDNL
jgi:hypothetical protein